MRSVGLAVCLGLISGLGGCNFKALTPDAVSEGIASKAYADFVTGRDDALTADFPKELDAGQQRKIIDAMRAMVPDGQGQAGKMVGWRFNTGTGGKTMNLTYLYDYPAGHVLFETTLFRVHDDDAWKVVGAHVSPASASDLQAPSFGQLPSPPPAKTAPGDS